MKFHRLQVGMWALALGLFLLTVPAAAGKLEGSLQALADLEAGLVALAEKTLPAVVNISPYVPPSPSIARSGSSHRRASNAGAGVVIDGEKGYIVTNSHVVRKAEKVTITLYQGEKLVGHTLGYDEDTDLAVVQVKTGVPLVAAELGDSSTLKVGQFAVAVGNPYGLNDTLTLGIISGLNRENINISRYEDFIQTDASINPGNSGGPLVNIRGEVIGINTAIINYAQSIGFAIPVNLVKYIARQLIENGEVQRGWLGVGIDILSEEVAQQAKIKKNEGVLVNSVFQGQPAAQAGIEVGDIILRIGGSRVTSPNKMIRVIGNITPGQSVQVDILREGEHKTVSVQLAKRVEDPAWMASLENPSFIHLGFDVKPLDFSLQRKYGLPASEGLVVTRIRPGSTAETSGLRAGDLIRAINGRPTGSREDIEKILQDNPESDWFFLVIRQEKTLHLTLKFGEG